MMIFREAAALVMPVELLRLKVLGTMLHVHTLQLPLEWRRGQCHFRRQFMRSRDMAMCMACCIPTCGLCFGRCA